VHEVAVPTEAVDCPRERPRLIGATEAFTAAPFLAPTDPRSESAMTLRQRQT
jgi:hypothetical protein